MDLDTHEVIDMIPSREISAVAQRLALFGNAKTLSRDGSLLYREAIEAAFQGREVKQVSDRFHIVKNCTDALLECLRRAIPKRVAVETRETPRAQRALFKDRAEKAVKAYRAGAKKSAVCREFSIAPKALEKLAAMGEDEFRDYFTTKAERLVESRRRAKVALVERARGLRDKGFTVAMVAEAMGIHRDTAEKYLEDGALEWASTVRPRGSRSALDAYEEQLRPMMEGGAKEKEIFEKALSLGFKGSYSTVKHYVSARRKRATLTVTKTLGYKEVSELLFFRRKEKKVKRAHLMKLFEACPEARTIIAMANKFRRIVTVYKKGEALDRWMEEAKTIEGMSSFIAGLERDLEAAKNGVESECSNAILEASVNKTKLFKRIMYGRCSFDSLRSKVLQNEKLKQ